MAIAGVFIALAAIKNIVNSVEIRQNWQIKAAQSKQLKLSESTFSHPKHPTGATPCQDCNPYPPAPRLS
jgi:hypothetical protein